MTQVAFPQLIDNMVAQFKSAPSLAGITIYDGIEIDESYPQSYIIVGHDGTENGEVVVNEARNEYKTLGAKSMFEDGVINCTLSAQTGDTSLSPMRQAAANLLSAVDTAIRLDPSFGGVVMYSGLSSHTTRYRQTQAGADVSVNFTVFYRAKT